MILQIKKNLSRGKNLFYFDFFRIECCFLGPFDLKLGINMN